jgi:flagellar biosynthesis/type III secretory pathway chaperone
MSVQPGDVRAHAVGLLNEEAALLNRLEAILDQERNVLRGDDTAAIEHIGANRHDCTAALTRLVAERDDSCRLLSFGSGRAGFEQLLRSCDSAGLLLQRWQANLQLTRRCRELNDRNGALVTVKLNHVQNLLGALRGEVAEPAYQPRPQFTVSFKTRELGVA